MSDKLTLVLDSSQIAAFLECPMLWNLGNKQNLALVNLPPNEPMLMGTFGHKIFDIFYKARAGGADLNSASQLALSFNPDQEVLPLSQLSRKQVQNRCLEYFAINSANDFKPDSPDAVEVGFSEVLYEDSDRLYVLEGRIDLLGNYQGIPVVVDHKFQLRTRDLYSKSIQFRNYSMIAKRNTLVVNYVRLTKGVTTDTLVRKLVSFNSVEHETWRRRLIRVYDQIADNLLHDNYPQNWSSCSGRFGSPCVFTSLCEESDQKLIQIKKQQLFVQREPWRPW